MNKILWMSLPFAALAAGPAVQSETARQTLSERQQAQYERMVEGRVAGEAKSCIPAHLADKMTTISDDVFVFAQSRNAKTIYINRPLGGCSGADRDTLVMQRFSSQLCRGDIGRVVDFTSGMTRGSCAMGDFVPYEKVKG